MNTKTLNKLTAKMTHFTYKFNI